MTEFCSTHFGGGMRGWWYTKVTLYILKVQEKWKWNIELTKSNSFCVGEFWPFLPTGVEDLLFVCPIFGRGDTLLNSPLVPECFWGAGSFEPWEWSAVFWFVLLLLLVLLLVFWVVSWYKIGGNIHCKMMARFCIV